MFFSGLFGLNVVKPDDKIICITEGEFDAMAVYQETGISSVSLPNGTNSLPIELVPFFDRFKQIYLWLDADEPGRAAATKIANVSQLASQLLLINYRLTNPQPAKTLIVLETGTEQMLYH